MVVEEAIRLAGFVLAQAAWHVSDQAEGDVLVPLAGVEADGARQFIVFEAETQDEAVAAAKTRMAALRAAAATWAFAREGAMRGSDGIAVDVIIVEAWAPGMDEPIAFVQAFRPAAAGAFKLLGAAVPVVDGQMLNDEAASPYRAALQRGIAEHAEAAPLWAGWQ